MGFFIPHETLQNLKLYKYSSEDHSLISKLILKQWWNTFVLIFPRSMAPNVITLLGFMFVIINIFTVMYYDPYLNQTVPSWCYFTYAIGLFAYQTFDGCDGCHARNTGQSSPLGELFDHSIDALNTTFGSIIVGSVLQLGYGKLLLLVHFASVANFYASTWEEYHTHTLFLSKFSGPVEGILMLVTLFIVAGIFGPDLFSTVLFNSNIFGIDVVCDIKTGTVVLGLGSLYFNIAQAIANVDAHYRKVGTPKRSLESHGGLIPFFAYYGSIVLLIAVYPEYLYQFGLPLILSIGLSVAFSVGRIIVAHLTMQKFPYIHFPMVIPVLQIIGTWFAVEILGYDKFDTFYSISWLGFGITLGIHGMFVNEIIYELTTYLDIYALSIKHKKE